MHPPGYPQKAPEQAESVANGNSEVVAAKAANYSVCIGSVTRVFLLLCGCTCLWLTASFLDAKYTPRDPTYRVPPLLILTYQCCMVGYTASLILTLLKVIFERNPSKMKLHLTSCYVNALAAVSYCMLWTGFSPIRIDVGSCLYIPQRWILYTSTAPAIIFILTNISDYTPRMQLWVIMLNVFMLVSGGLATIPFISWPHKVFWYFGSCAPFPSILFHMWRMVETSLAEISEPTSRNSINFIRFFSIATWNCFPVVYFISISGIMPIDQIEPVWAVLDWVTKMVYSSSLMEANFFTIAQRRENVMKAVEEAHRLHTIEQLSKAIERKDNFLSTMSHELRTPLNGIIGLSDSLLAGSAGNMSEKAYNTVSTIGLSGKRLLQLVNDILDAAKMKQGTVVIKHLRVDLKRLVNDVLELTLPLVRRGVRLVNEIGDVPVIIGDNDRIVQILYNLVGNAAKFTPSGTISINAGIADDNKHVFVSVQDTGVGIMKSKISSIFGAFEQADMSTTRRYGGTGLGLHLVKELVKAHNGQIMVDSQINKGSRFVVLLPMQQPELRYDDEPPAVRPAAPALPQPLMPSALLGKATPMAPPGSGCRGEGEGSATADTASSRKPPPASGAGGMHGAWGAALDAPAGVGGGRSSVSGVANDSMATRGSQRPSPSWSESSKQHVAHSAGPTHSVTEAPEDVLRVRKPFYREKHGSCMVLSVDDDIINQYVVAELLTLEGYRVEQAMSGKDALNFLEASEMLPDVVLLDVMMPDMNGYEVCQTIHERYTSISIPVIMVSANGSIDDVKRGFESGSVDYVKKPFNREELISRVRAQIRNREAFEAEMQSRRATERLKSIMPLSVVQRLQAGRSMIADQHNEVTVLKAGLDTLQQRPARDVQAYTSEVVMHMNKLSSVFELIFQKFNVFCVEQTGKSYTVVSGHDGTQDHVDRILTVAKEMMTESRKLSAGVQQLQLRIGVCVGPAYSGVVGVSDPHYCVFGKTVSEASELQTHAPPDTMLVSSSVFHASQLRDRFVAYRPLAAGLESLATYMAKLGRWEAALLQSQPVPTDGQAGAQEQPGLKELSKAQAQLRAAKAEARRLQDKAKAADALRAEADAKLDVLKSRNAQLEALMSGSANTRGARTSGSGARLLHTLPPAAKGSISGPDSLPGGNWERPPAGRSDRPLAGGADRCTAGSPDRPPAGGVDHLPGGNWEHPPAGSSDRPLAGSTDRFVAGSEGSAAPMHAHTSAGWHALIGGGGGWHGPPSVVAPSDTGSMRLSRCTTAQLLNDIGLGRYVALMHEQEVTPLVLAAMTDEELESIGVEAYGARYRMLEAAKQYKSKLESVARMMMRQQDAAGGGADAHGAHAPLHSRSDASGDGGDGGPSREASQAAAALHGSGRTGGVAERAA